MSSSAFVTSESVAWQQMAPGVVRQILGYDEELMMVSVRFDRGSIGPPHSHPHRQVSFVIAGRFRVQIGDEQRILGAGDCFIVAPDVIHGAVALEDGALVDVFTPAREDFLAAGALQVPAPSRS